MNRIFSGTRKHGEVNPWLIALTVMLATFLEVLDTSVANVALPHIAGDLSAGVDESTWVLTSYLVSNAIVLPLTGWLSSLFGRKRFFMACVAIFTVCSFLCGIAPSLGLLVVFPHLAGGGRRRASADFAGDPGGKLSQGKAGHGDGGLWDGCGRGAGRRSYAGGLDHGQLHLAMDILHQYPCRGAFPPADRSAHLRPALPGAQEPARPAD